MLRDIYLPAGVIEKQCAITATLLIADGADATYIA
jgi:hypothetical protein